MSEVFVEKPYFAFLCVDENRRFVSWGRSSQYSSWQGIACGPMTPMVELILGIWQRYPREAQRILRNRIYVNYEPTLVCRETCKVGAKRFTMAAEFVVPSEPNLESVQFSLDAFANLIQFENSYDTLLSSRTDPENRDEEQLQAMLLAEARAMRDRLLSAEDSRSRSGMALVVESQNSAESEIETTRHSQNRRVLLNRLISCSLLKSSGEVLGRAHNGAEHGLVFHAETLLLLALWSRTHAQVPRDVILLTSLKCCRMCAAFFWFLSESPLQSRVFYIEKDLGRWGRETVLNAKSSVRRSLPMLKELSVEERTLAEAMELETQVSLL